MNNTLAALIVTYEPENEIINNIKNLSGVVDAVYVFDNNSKTSRHLLLALDDMEHVNVIFHGENIGLSKAQNYLINKIKDDFDWIITLDDDTNVSRSSLRFIRDQLLSIDKSVGVIVPLVFDLNDGGVSLFTDKNNSLKRIKPSEEPLNVLVAISSGMIIRTSVFRDVGLMNEDYFIDYIDIEFSLRVNDKYDIRYIPGYTINHRLGKKERIKVFCFNFSIYNHSPFRRFYIYRNRVRLWKTRFLSNKVFIIRDFVQAFWDAFKILCFEKNKRENLKSILKGVYSGLFYN